jgi:hypothetical protein
VTIYIFSLTQSVPVPSLAEIDGARGEDVVPRGGVRRGHVVHHRAPLLPDVVELAPLPRQRHRRVHHHLLAAQMLRGHVRHREPQLRGLGGRHRRRVAVEQRRVRDQAPVGVLERHHGLGAHHAGAVRVQPPRDPPALGQRRRAERHGHGVGVGRVVVVQRGAETRQAGARLVGLVVGEGVASAGLRGAETEREERGGNGRNEHEGGGHVFHG